MIFRESRRSPTYEAYSRSRRYASTSYRFSDQWLIGISLHLRVLSILVYLNRSRSRSRSPSYSRRYDRGGLSDNGHRSKSRAPKIEYITEFGGSADVDDKNPERVSPPPSPVFQADVLNRSEHSTFNSCKDRLDNVFTAAAYTVGYFD